MSQSLSIELLLGVEESTSHRVRKFGYGDGYEQILPDGVNSKVRSYNIITSPISDASAITLVTALDEVCDGDTFEIQSLEPFFSIALDQPALHFRLADNTYSRSYLPASDKFQFTFVLQEAFVN